MKRLIFGITGATGAGKSTVSESFRRLGVNVIDADAVYHTLIKASMPCTNELSEEFGADILFDNGEINRKKLAAIVFNDKNKLEKLNKITHKYIRERISELMGNSSVCAIDAAALIGSDMQDMCKYMVAVTADEEIRCRRVIKRDGIGEDAARQRIAAQKKDSFYIENSDFVIYNNGGEDIEKEARKILKAMVGKEYKWGN